MREHPELWCGHMCLVSAVLCDVAGHNHNKTHSQQDTWYFARALSQAARSSGLRRCKPSLVDSGGTTGLPLLVRVEWESSHCLVTASRGQV
jgi:hypothetical protein